MSDLPDKIAAEHYYSPKVGGCGACKRTYPTLDREFTFHALHISQITEATVREDVASDLEAGLPSALIDEIADPNGWLSDAQYGAVLSATNGTSLHFSGQGSLDLDHAASHAAQIARNGIKS